MRNEFGFNKLVIAILDYFLLIIAFYKVIAFNLLCFFFYMSSLPLFMIASSVAIAIAIVVALLALRVSLLFLLPLKAIKSDNYGCPNKLKIENNMGSNTPKMP